jgi:hypothetical protein
MEKVKPRTFQSKKYSLKPLNYFQNLNNKVQIILLDQST